MADADSHTGIPEKNLAGSRDFLKEIEESGNIGAWMYDPDTGRRSWTSQIFRILEWDPSQPPPGGSAILEFISASCRDQAMKAVERALSHGEGFDDEWEITTSKGSLRWVHVVAKIEGKPGGGRLLKGSIQDITSRRRAQAELQASESRYSLLFDTMDEGVAINEIVLDAEGFAVDYRILEVNRAFERHSPYKLADARGNYATALYKMSPAFIREWWESHSLLTSAISTEYFHEASGFWFSITTTPREGLRFITIFRNITERKKSEEALRESALRFDQLAEQSGTVAWETDCEGIFTYISEVAEKVYGYRPEELVGRKRPSDLEASPEREAFAAFLGGTYARKEPFRNKVHAIEHKSGAIAWMTGNGFPLLDPDGTLRGYRGSDTDITLRKRMEEALTRSQRLESLGILAGGVAHDFNNLLAGIYGYVELSRLATTEPTVKMYMDLIMNNIDRTRALTLQLLTFSKGGAPVVRPERLGSFIEETVQFALGGSAIRSSLRIDPDLWPAIVDRNQIGQVLDNIVINAVQAMPDGGMISVAARNVRIAKSQHPGLESGEYLAISIRDDGEGIRPDLLPRIFDPFFTTKPGGQGLGLATCYSIVHKHSGLLEAESEPGKGTVFHIYLPAHSEAETGKRSAHADGHRGQGTLLILDDEKAIRDSLAELLGHMGYSVITAEDGRTALSELQRAAREGIPIRAGIVDLTLPGPLDGKQTARSILASYPDLPLFILSGYAQDSALADPKAFGFTASLRKPFNYRELEDLLERHLPRA